MGIAVRSKVSKRKLRIKEGLNHQREQLEQRQQRTNYHIIVMRTQNWFHHFIFIYYAFLYLSSVRRPLTNNGELGFLSVQRYHRTYSSGKIRLGSYWLRKIGIDMIAFRIRRDIRLRIVSMRIGNRRMRIWCRLPKKSYCRWLQGWILRISRDGNIGIYICGGIGFKVWFCMGFQSLLEMPLHKFYFTLPQRGPRVEFLAQVYCIFMQVI